VLACPFVFISCAAPTALVPHRAEPVLYEWHDDGGPGKVTITIDLDRQIASYSRGGRPIGWSYVATGKEGYGTSPGQYSITEKIVDKYSNKYGWIEDDFGNVVDDDASPGDRVPPGCRYVAAPMPYWMRLTSYGIGMHAGIIPQPGEPASHGCIRLPKPFAPQLFEVVQVGTPVKITRGGPMPPSRPEAVTPGRLADIR
jgi:lipoprotein-anchoring transpeptidase ErfK/SrfK